MDKTLPATHQIVNGLNNEVTQSQKGENFGHFMICSVGLAVLNNFGGR